MKGTEAKIKQMNTVPQSQQKLTYEQLTEVANQAHQQAEMWQKRAYEAASKNSRLDILFGALDMALKYEQAGLHPFISINKMASELEDILYPSKEMGEEEPQPEQSGE